MVLRDGADEGLARERCRHGITPEDRSLDDVNPYPRPSSRKDMEVLFMDQQLLMAIKALVIRPLKITFSIVSFLWILQLWLIAALICLEQHLPSTK